MSSTEITTSEYVCSACRATLVENSCAICGRAFPSVAGLPDLRVSSDRFLDLPGERAKAERLARLAPKLDLKGLAEAYYAMTPDVEARGVGGFYLGHILGAEARGSALAALLPGRGRKILEVGCGTGGLLAAARRLGLEIEGVRHRPPLAGRRPSTARRPRALGARWSPPRPIACLMQMRVFDAVVADSLLEHLDDPAAGVSRVGPGPPAGMGLCSSGRPIAMH